MNFYKHWIGDYARDTAQLSLLEHGAFRLMLDNFYGTSRPLPTDKKALYRILRAENAAERKAIDTVSLKFWRRLPEELEELYSWLNLKDAEERQMLGKISAEWTKVEGLVNVRALHEIVKAEIIADTNRKTAHDREAKRRAQRMLGVKA